MKPVIEVIYEGVNITADITSRLLSLTYTDKIAGEVDEVQIALENTDDLWISEWLPEMGDLIDVRIGYPGNLLDCGTFAVDDITASAPPSTVTLKAIAASRKSTLRTKVSNAYESLTLRQIAQGIADKQGLTLVDQFITNRTEVSYEAERSALLIAVADIRAAGTLVRFSTIQAVQRLLAAARDLITKGKQAEGQRIIDDIQVLLALPLPLSVAQARSTLAAIERFLRMVEQTATNLRDETFETSRSRLDSVRISRATQNRETDLGFLNRVSEKYGYRFSVRGNQLIFIYHASIEDVAAVIELSPVTLKRWSISRKSTGTFTSVKASYRDPQLGELVSYTEQYSGGEDVSSDIMELRERFESIQQAQEASTSKLSKANQKATEGSISIVGNPRIVAGVNISFTGIGRYSGTYTASETTHTVSKSGGYETSATINRVRQ